MVYLWRIFKWADVDRGRMPVVHHDHRHPDRIAVLQICGAGVLAVRQNSDLRRRDGKPDRKCAVADHLRNPDGDRKRHHRLSVVHYNRRNPVRQAVFQDC